MIDVLNIALLKRLDQSVIDAAIAAPETLTILLTNQYDDGLTDEASVNVNDMDSTTLTAFKTVTDYLSYLFEAGCPVFKIAYDELGYEWDLSDSYLRDAVSTASPTAMTADQPLTVRFEFPSFVTGEAIEAVFEYGTGFSSADKLALGNAGVSVIDSGTTFRITNSTRECKVTFSKPVSELGAYVIQQEQQEYIIPKI